MTEQEAKREKLRKRLEELKETDAWLDGDKKAEKEVNAIRKELAEMKEGEDTAMDRILKRCEPTAEELGQ